MEIVNRYCHLKGKIIIKNSLFIIKKVSREALFMKVFSSLLFQPQEKAQKYTKLKHSMLQRFRQVKSLISNEYLYNVSLGILRRRPRTVESGTGTLDRWIFKVDAHNLNLEPGQCVA